MTDTKTKAAPSPYDLGPVTTQFGEPSAFTGAPHSGVDIGVSTGTPIPAFIGGVVERVFQDSIGGVQVIVRTPDGFRETYAHLSAVNVQPGQNVSSSDVVGWSGATGHVTGPHLHYEVHNPAGALMDPRTFLGEFAGAVGDAASSAADAVTSGSSSSTSSGGKPATPALTAATCGLDAATITVIGDRLRAGQKPQEIADALTKSLGRPITVECMRNDAYRAASDVGKLVDAATSIPVLGGIAQGAAASITTASGFFGQAGSAGKLAFTLVGGALIILGVFMYLGALRTDHAVAAAANARGAA